MKLPADFQLREALWPLDPSLFKGQLYTEKVIYLYSSHVFGANYTVL